ncbi:MAG: HD domain-containing protein, partial [Pseudobutyrivibrio sp.]|nr:HD domain-containing protein [Pseudobutyrivibrio sp.]
VWQCFGTNLYYSSVELIQKGSVTITKTTDGPLKIIQTAYIGVMLALIIAAIVVSIIRKGKYSRKTLFNYAIIILIGLLMYIVEMVADADFTMLPFLYVVVDVLIAIDYDHIHMHDISALISDQQNFFSTKGYVAVDFRKRFLSCNDRAAEFFEFLKTQREDEALPKAEALFEEMIEEYELNKVTSRKFKIRDITCVCEINEFSVRKDGIKQGYLFEIRDATEEQKVLDVMEAYTTTLNAEVEEKTENISAIQQKIVVGMANIIENRDNNTGGHVKRTSDVVTILVDEINKQGKLDFDNEFTSDIVRAAPMHDLGKVSIDSSILCKPGRLDENEYSVMKSHSEKSGEMVNILLEGVEEEHFVNVAYNVARFHHERWDGRGYPEGLVGSMIPIEARIMAIADVYDALVSKRCYKEPM